MVSPNYMSSHGLTINDLTFTMTCVYTDKRSVEAWRA